MILSGSEIKNQVLAKRITISPFNEQYLTTNSYDFHLGEKIITYKKETLDCKIENETIEQLIPDEGLVILPNKLYLGHTLEVMGSNHFVPIIRGKSSTGRMGLFVHITAGLIDIGSINQYTLMLHSTQPVRIYKGMKIGQATFWTVKGEIELYKGKYRGLSGPQPSQVYKDF